MDLSTTTLAIMLIAEHKLGFSNSLALYQNVVS